MMNTARDTLTIRNNPSQEALPMRKLGSFLPGDVVGGSAVHWSGHTWRWTDNEFKIRSNYEARYGKKYIPEDMTIQDWGITYAELEPYYEKVEIELGVSGQAGNVPMFSHLAESNYFQIHHTPADTVERITPKQAADNAATIAVMAYVIADLPWRLGSEK